MANQSIHAYVQGRVQGVYFRASTQKKAQSLALTGWVKNLDDGRVELMATGAELSLQSLCKWLEHGPVLARVDDLQIEWLTEHVFAAFDVV